MTTSKKPKKAPTSSKAKGAPKGRGKAKEAPAASGEPAEADDASASHEGSQIGRPPKYKPEFIDRAREMCSNGATDYELAQEFGVNTKTIWRWQAKYPDFCHALKVHKGEYDKRVERSLAQRALGYTFESEKVFQHNGAIIRAQVIEHLPPDPVAAKLWLCNRMPDEWRDKQSHEHTGADGAPLFADLMALIDGSTRGVPGAEG